MLTEDDVLELREEQIYGDRVDVKKRRVELEEEAEEELEP